jgi:hypothetical protein
VLPMSGMSSSTGMNIVDADPKWLSLPEPELR